MREEVLYKRMSAQFGTRITKLYFNGEVEYCINSGVAMSFTDDEREIVLDKVLQMPTPTLPVIFTWNQKYYFGTIPCKDYYLIFGPFVPQIKFKPKYDFTVSDTIEYPVKNEIKLSIVINALRFLFEFFNDVDCSESEIYAYNFADPELEKELKQKTTEILFDYGEESKSHHTLAPIERLEDCIKSGNVDMVIDAAQEILAEPHGITSKNYLRNEKNLAIAGITNVTKAAITGGVNYELAYSMSDSFIMRFESANDTYELTKIFFQACHDYTQLVKERIESTSNKQPQTNYYTEKAKKYISSHLHELIEVQEIANHLDITPNYLSAIFKKNEKINITDYIFQEKINQAKRLLIYSDKSYSDIAFHLGFSSQSHFSQVFKKHTGVTPKQFTMNNSK